jgi:hypothetical protein
LISFLQTRAFDAGMGAQVPEMKQNNLVVLLHFPGTRGGGLRRRGRIELQKGMTMMHRNVLWAAVLFLAAAAPALAQGLVIPDEPDLPPLALVRHRVRVEIDRQASVTTIEQVFLNNTDRQLEAQYVFPIPRGATMSRFTMLVNGKEKAGEVVEKNQARQIYNSIVRRAEDPGLLEYLGGEIFRANIFPVAPRGSQTITLRFEQILNAQDSLVNYTYPVRASTRRGPTVQGEFSIEATIKSAAPILNVYSPSHAITVARPDDREARVTFFDRRTTLDKDFTVYYSVSDKEIGLNLVTYRPDAANPGYFMLLLAPKTTLQVDRIVERDVVFVVDTSGSMAGEKIKQARNALKYLVSKLNDGDRFNIVTFSSFAETWQRGLVGAKDKRDEGLKFSETLLAQGGTDIAGAFDAAASCLMTDPARPSYIVFMTDGKPTMGETTDPKKILAKVIAAKGGKGGESLRLFTWGVGYDVDTHLPRRHGDPRRRRQRICAARRGHRHQDRRVRQQGGPARADGDRPQGPRQQGPARQSPSPRPARPLRGRPDRAARPVHRRRGHRDAAHGPRERKDRDLYLRGQVRGGGAQVRLHRAALGPAPHRPPARRDPPARRVQGARRRRHPPVEGVRHPDALHEPADPRRTTASSAAAAISRSPKRCGRTSRAAAARSWTASGPRRPRRSGGRNPATPAPEPPAPTVAAPAKPAEERERDDNFARRFKDKDGKAGVDVATSAAPAEGSRAGRGPGHGRRVPQGGGNPVLPATTASGWTRSSMPRPR